MERDTPLARAGGPAGLVQSAIPSVLFVLVYQTFGLVTGVCAAVAAVAALAIGRRVRGESVRPALGGGVGVGVSSFLALRSGSARDYFLPDIWLSGALAVVFTVSILVGRPLAGVLWSALTGTPRVWRHDSAALRDFSLATGVFAAGFAVRFAVQRRLYTSDDSAAMALVRVAVNYPLWIAGLVALAWAIRRSNRRAGEPGPKLSRSGAVRGVDSSPGHGPTCPSPGPNQRDAR